MLSVNGRRRAAAGRRAGARAHDGGGARLRGGSAGLPQVVRARGGGDAAGSPGAREMDPGHCMWHNVALSVVCGEASRSCPSRPSTLLSRRLRTYSLRLLAVQCSLPPSPPCRTHCTNELRAAGCGPPPCAAPSRHRKTHTRQRCRRSLFEWPAKSYAQPRSKAGPGGQAGSGPGWKERFVSGTAQNYWTHFRQASLPVSRLCLRRHLRHSASLLCRELCAPDLAGAHSELVKVRVWDTSEDDADDAAERLGTELRAAMCGKIGSTVLFARVRPSGEGRKPSVIKPLLDAA